MGWNKNLVDYRKVPRTEVGGRSFASKLEASLYAILLLMERAGEIQNIKCQDHVYLTEARYHCIPDFKVFDLKLNESVWYEAKGFEQPRWGDTKKLWSVYGPGRLRVYKGKASRPYLHEEIYPRGPKLG